MFKFYRQRKNGTRGKLLGACEPSDNFYFDFFRYLAKDAPTIIESEFDGRVSCSFIITETYSAPPVNFDVEPWECTGCQDQVAFCDCYKNAMEGKQ